MIKTARKRHDLTQKELASRCNLSQSFLSQLENRTTSKNVTLKQMVKIATALKICPYKLSNWFVNKELNAKYEYASESGVA